MFSLFDFLIRWQTQCLQRSSHLNWNIGNLKTSCLITNQLKIVIMELSDGGSDVELMKYLLKNTKELEEASIIYSPPVPTKLIIELKKYKTLLAQNWLPFTNHQKNMFHLCKGFFFFFFFKGLESL